MKLPEILAPAGSWASLTAAINAGCDSCYLGVAEMNMRASAAKNFELKDLSKIVEYCHENNVKVFVTVNTLLYNNEVDKMRKIVDECKRTGVDAIIVADMATIQYADEVGMSMQISTQLSVSNTESLKFYSRYADRVVLARELTLPQIRKIKDDIIDQDIRGPNGELMELELFAHGALCVAVSGRCSMSLFEADRSANRGRCVQVCRRKFKVINDDGKEMVVDNNYVMSAADLCTIGMLPELIEAGADVLKFEGRGRAPEYVDTVISIYKNALESIEEGNYNQKNIKKWREALGVEFNRGQSEGLYRGVKFAKWAGVEGNQAKVEKLQVGKVTNYYQKIGVVEVAVLSKVDVNEGDKFLITGGKTGVVRGTLGDIRVFGKEDNLLDKKSATQGEVFTFKLSSQVRRSDSLYILRGS
jgi:putative protease